MKNENNIEKIFQDGFENYQPEVNPDIWNSIESRVQAGGNTPPQSDGGSSSVVQSLVKSTQLWVATTIITVGVVTTIAVINNFNDDTEQSPVTSSNQENTTKEKQKDLQNTPQQDSQEEPGELDQPVVQDTVNNTIDRSESQGSTSPVENSASSTSSESNSSIKNENVTSTTNTTNTNEVSGNEISENASETNNEKESSSTHDNPPVQKTIDFSRSIVSNSESFSVGSESTFKLDNTSEVEKMNWYLNGKRVSSNSSAGIQFDSEGNQLIEAEVVFSNGKEKIYDYTAHVKASSYLGQFEPGSIKSGLGQLPNTFSPNSDGKNDFFSVESKNIASFNIIIFDAKGQMVFGSEKANFKWDGNDRFGKPLEEKQFRYSIRAVGKDGQQYQTEGQLIIYR